MSIILAHLLALTTYLDPRPILVVSHDSYTYENWTTIEVSDETGLYFDGYSFRGRYEFVWLGGQVRFRIAYL